jgi:dCMP deaminase
MEAGESKQGKWDRRFLALARHLATWSIDPSTRVGCVIAGPANEVRAVGYNGLPRNVDHSPDRLERPDKYIWMEHAERNAIYTAARNGVALEGCRMYVSWFPCVDCARAAIQVGIVEIVALEPDWSSAPWGPELSKARELLIESNVRLRMIHTDEVD